MPISHQVRDMLTRRYPGWRIVEPQPKHTSTTPDAVSSSLAEMQRKYIGHITTLDTFREEYPQLSASVAQARFRAQLHTQGAVLDDNGKIVGMQDG